MTIETVKNKESHQKKYYQERKKLKKKRDQKDYKKYKATQSQSQKQNELGILEFYKT